MKRHPAGLGSVGRACRPHRNRTGRLEDGIDGLSAWVTVALPGPLLPCVYIRIHVGSVPYYAGPRRANRRKSISAKSIVIRVPPTSRKDGNERELLGCSWTKPCPPSHGPHLRKFA